jgi:ribosomal protein S16
MGFRITLKNKGCKNMYNIVVIKQPINKTVGYLGFYDSASGNARVKYITMLKWCSKGAIFSKRVLGIVGNIGYNKKNE